MLLECLVLLALLHLVTCHCLAQRGTSGTLAQVSSRSRSRRRRRSRSGKRKKDSKDTKDGKDDRNGKDGKGGKDGKTSSEAQKSSKETKDGKTEVSAGKSTAAQAEEEPKKLVYRKTWDMDKDGNRRHCSAWARRWRIAMGAILPSGQESACPLSDTDLQKLGMALWKEVADWAAGTEAARCLELLRAEPQVSTTTTMPRFADPDRPPSNWALLPLCDILLVVGGGVIGVTAEGVFAEAPGGHKRMSLAKFQELAGANGLSIPF